MSPAQAFPSAPGESWPVHAPAPPTTKKAQPPAIRFRAPSTVRFGRDKRERE